MPPENLSWKRKLRSVSRICIPASGTLVWKCTWMPSAGWIWITSRFASGGALELELKSMCGGWRNWITICVVAHDITLPLRRKNGTPCHRQLSTSSLTAAKVAVRLPAATPGSSRYPR